MGSLNQLLIVFLLALSPVIGYLLGRAVKEELRPGKKWFFAAKRVLFVAIAAAFLYPHRMELWYVVIGLAILFAYFAFKQFRTWWYVQGILAIAYSLVPEKFLIASLIFIYGLPTGTIIARKKNLNGALLAGVVFLAVATVLWYFL